MKNKINPDNDVFDPSEEYFKKEENTYDHETEEYFPKETSKPPHYWFIWLRLKKKPIYLLPKNNQFEM